MYVFFSEQRMDEISTNQLQVIWSGVYFRAESQFEMPIQDFQVVN